MKLPFAWPHLLRYLSTRHTPVLEAVTDDAWRRGDIVVRYRGGSRLLVRGKPDRARLTRLFDLDCDPAAIARHFARCSLMGPRVRAVPGLRIPGTWEPFELVLRTILGQQVSVAGAQTLFSRLIGLCPSCTPDEVASADLGKVGLTRQRAETLKTVARLFRESPDPPLIGVRGIGPWTLAYLAIRLGRDRDAFPSSDLGLLRATGCSSSRELEKLAEKWRPFRGYAAHYLWSVEAPRALDE